MTPIAFVCHPYHRGGVTRWMADAAIAAARQGRQVYFVTVRPSQVFYAAKGRETMYSLVAASQAVQVVSCDAGHEFEFGSPEYRVYVYSKLLAKLPTGTALVLSDDASVWEACVGLSGAFRIVGVLHADENYYYGLAKKYHHRVDELVCVSRRVRANAAALLPAGAARKLSVIPCGINLPEFRRQAGGHDGGTRLVYVGRVSDYQKRAGDLVGLCALLAREGFGFHLEIIGDGDARHRIEKECGEQGLQQYVTFTGWLDQATVGQRLSGADILVLVSDFEGTPVAMMEALANGCGMVGTRVSGIEDYEQSPFAEACISIFDVGDLAAAAQCIKELSAVPAARRGAAARKIAEAEFSMEVCLARYYKVIDVEKNCEQPVALRLSPTKKIYSKMLSLARLSKLRLTGKHV